MSGPVHDLGRKPPSVAGLTNTTATLASRNRSRVPRSAPSAPHSSGILNTQKPTLTTHLLVCFVLFYCRLQPCSGFLLVSSDRNDTKEHQTWHRHTFRRQPMAKIPRRQKHTTSNSANCSSLKLPKYVHPSSLPRGAPQPSKSQLLDWFVLTNGQSLEVVLQNINKLNRSLEEVTSVGNEFAPVESLWSHFENVMAKDPSDQQEGAQEGATEHEGETEVPQDRK